LDDWEKAANELITLAKNTAISDIEFGQQLTGLEVESQKYLTTSVWQLEEQLREYYEKVQKILKLHEEFDKAEFLYTKIVQLYDSDYFNHNSDWVFHPCWVEDKENDTSNEKVKWLKKKLKHPKQDVLKMG
jgi:hypothetical protein